MSASDPAGNLAAWDALTSRIYAGREDWMGPAGAPGTVAGAALGRVPAGGPCCLR
jgi:hypothetical protein